MVKVIINFFTAIKEVTQKNNYEVFLDSTPPVLGELISRIIEEFGPGLESSILKEGTNALRPGIAVAINGRQSVFLKGMETPLKDGDKVSIGLIGK